MESYVKRPRLNIQVFINLRILFNYTHSVFNPA